MVRICLIKDFSYRTYNKEMFQLKKLAILTPFFCTLSLATSGTVENFHIVRPGEIFSRIARKSFGAPTYSKSGAMARLMALNPEIRDFDHLKPGQRLRISELNSRPIASESEDESLKQPVIIEQKESTTTKYSEIIFEPDFRFVRMDATDSNTKAKAIILSKSYIHIPIIWQQFWDKDFSSFQRVSMAFAQFDDSGNKTISNKSVMPLGFGFGFKFFNDRKYRFFTELAVDQYLFARSDSASSIKLETIAIPNLRLGTEYDLLKSHPFTLGLKLRAASYLAAKSQVFTIKNGFGYGAGLYLRQFYKSSFLAFNLNFDEIIQNTSITDQTRTDLSGSFSYTLETFQ